MNAIKAGRKKICMSQVELLVKMGLDPTHKSKVSNWETGKHIPNHASARKLAEILGGEASDYRTESDNQGIK